MTTFDKYLETIIDSGATEAQSDGSATIEAHHLLLAIAAGREGVTFEALSSVGLDHRAIRNALDREFEHSLSAVGVSLAAFDLPRPSSAHKRPTQLGASAKLGIERSVGSVARKRDLRPAHLLLGVLQAQVGTVSRALTQAGIDQADLKARLQQALADQAE
ncbi:Clp protease N-terminal domain-containing protein [Nocardia australiensis]|uniref:Clp protease N-terminal domain-containing protein n=1 Tax=Nocardia australiensis TaxID=2887191 RepID=UPI001D13AF11|nr:Clp protease N-terminal domain-containing protein [Nocardia australiensis]